MAWKIVQMESGDWKWEAFQSAYGCALGSAATFEAALVRLAICEAEMSEDPYPEDVCDEMMAHPEAILATAKGPDGKSASTSFPSMNKSSGSCFRTR